MTETERMVLEINSLFKALGDPELRVSKLDGQGELAYLREVRETYTTRLMEKMPRYRALPIEAVPDLFLEALRNREAKLGAKR